jgi:ABC-type transport system involved in multi-copper enzyme maturation permease subunit
VNRGLLRYARYQLPDFLQRRLVLPLILLAISAGMPTWLMTRHSPPGFMESAQGIALAKQMFSQSITLFLPLGAFVGAVGAISADRQQGYFRLLFSKPVNVLAYYAQTYLLHAIAYVVVFGLIVWGFSAYTIPFSVFRSMEAAALTFVLIGGIGLLLGALTRFDGMGLIVVYVLALILQQLAMASNGLTNGGLSGWVVAIARGLPPVVKLDSLRNQLYAGEALDMAQLWHVLGYGGGAAILGFLLLRRLPLAR